MPVLATVWLTVLLAKAYLRPGYANDVFPVWGTVWLSSFIVPFWLGLLAYYVRDRGRRWRWLIGAGLVAFVAKVPWMARHQEQAWLAWGVAAVVAVWFAAAVRQLPQRNVLVWFGDRTYGLYLVHVPVTLTTFYLLRDRGWLVGVFEQVVFWNYSRASLVDVGLLGAILVGLLLQRDKLSRADDALGVAHR